MHVFKLVGGSNPRTDRQANSTILVTLVTCKFSIQSIWKPCESSVVSKLIPLNTYTCPEVTLAVTHQLGGSRSGRRRERLEPWEPREPREKCASPDQVAGVPPQELVVPGCELVAKLGKLEGPQACSGLKSRFILKGNDVGCCSGWPD